MLVGWLKIRTVCREVLKILITPAPPPLPEKKITLHIFVYSNVEKGLLAQQVVKAESCSQYSAIDLGMSQVVWLLTNSKRLGAGDIYRGGGT